MSTRKQGSAPALAAEEQQRGDNSARRTIELLAAGRPVTDHQAATRNAFENAARHGEQPAGGAF